LIVTRVDPSLRLSDFDYHLPEELIAQHPPADRDGGRLLLVDRSHGTLTDLTVRDLPALLHERDLVVVNNTRVIPARLWGRKATGGAVELLLLNRQAPGKWEALAKPARKLPPGTAVTLVSRAGDAYAPAEIVANLGEGRVHVSFDPDLECRLEEFGKVPLPPYIHEELADTERYQTVFSRIPGSAAAPTAGLHLTATTLSQFAERGIEEAEVTLQIGLDTFRPVTVDTVAEHVIHREWCSVPAQTAAALKACRANGGRVVAIGTTSARTLETWGSLDADVRDGEWSGWTDIFITPGYRWTTVDALLTNFHLPRSTLLMMISSFAGRDLTAAAYRHAVEQRYRFFSFGDAMLIV
jgi:S-adenosylmethionine:tRNA ribosyltransferase-isomerase